MPRLPPSSTPPRPGAAAAWVFATVITAFGCAVSTAALASREEITAIHDLLARGHAQAALERLQARQGPLVLVNGAPGDEAELRFLHGVALMDLGRDAQALAWFERMAQDHPELPDPYNNIALLHVRAGRLEPARQALEAALRNDPSFRTARANLGLVHLMLAVQAFEQVAAGGPVDWQLTRRLEGARALLAAPTR
ncbi:MAG: tetratricopeptide repeat protein [Rubrivivax sp.]|nr:tetratricopeptide repeat protein [Rubrivivax sp.]